MNFDVMIVVNLMLGERSPNEIFPRPVLAVKSPENVSSHRQHYYPGPFA